MIRINNRIINNISWIIDDAVVDLFFHLYLYHPRMEKEAQILLLWGLLDKWCQCVVVVVLLLTHHHHHHHGSFQFHPILLVHALVLPLVDVVVQGPYRYLK